jgi:hypothetical protein
LPFKLRDNVIFVSTLIEQLSYSCRGPIQQVDAFEGRVVDENVISQSMPEQAAAKGWQR